MDSSELQQLALHTRSMREMGITLIVASGILALLLFSPSHKQPAPVAAAPIAVPNAFAYMPVEAKAAIVYDLATAETLYAKNADAQLPLASLTKLLTIYAALSELAPTTPISIPPDATKL